MNDTILAITLIYIFTLGTSFLLMSFLHHRIKTLLSNSLFTEIIDFFDKKDSLKSFKKIVLITEYNHITERYSIFDFVFEFVWDFISYSIIIFLVFGRIKFDFLYDSNSATEDDLKTLFLELIKMENLKVFLIISISAAYIAFKSEITKLIKCIRAIKEAKKEINKMQPPN